VAPFLKAELIVIETDVFFDAGSFPVEKVMVKRIPISKLKFPLAKIPSPTGGELTI